MTETISKPVLIINIDNVTVVRWVTIGSAWAASKTSPVTSKVTFDKETLLHGGDNLVLANSGLSGLTIARDLPVDILIPAGTSIHFFQNNAPRTDATKRYPDFNASIRMEVSVGDALIAQLKAIRDARNAGQVALNLN